MKKKILLISDPTFYKTGLSRNISLVLSYLYETGKYELVHLCCGVPNGTPKCTLTPWKTIGGVPTDPQTQALCANDPIKQRDAGYGMLLVDRVVQEEKPDIIIGSNDSWSFNGIFDHNWSNKPAIVLHITIDSLPLLVDQLEQAKKTRYYISWSKFGEKAFKDKDPEMYSHVSSIYGALDTNVFTPYTRDEKKEIKKSIGINPEYTIIGMVSRNQLRKKFWANIEGLAKFKDKYPKEKVKLLFNTTWETWPLDRTIQEYIDSGYKNLDFKDILFTYYCDTCKSVVAHPFGGTKGKCPKCQAGDMIVPSITKAPSIELLVNKVYGAMDGVCHLMDSGGLEYAIPEALSCGIPTATIGYSSGEDFVENSFVHTIKHTLTREMGTDFFKAVPDTDSVCGFIERIHKMTHTEWNKISRKSRAWAIENFDRVSVGKKWEELIDSLPKVEYTDSDFKYTPMNSSYPLKDIPDDKEWLIDMYKNILNTTVSENDSGLLDWLRAIKAGRPRDTIYKYFIKVALDSNQKQDKISFEEFLGDEGKDNRVALALPESLADVILATSLFEDFRNQYPDKKLYFITKKEYIPAVQGSEYIDKIIEWHPFMDNVQAMEQAYFDVFIALHFLNQRKPNYIRNGRDKTAINYALS